MKQCPECNRVYYDKKLNFCLDDGEWLLDVSNSGEQATEIILPAERTSEEPTVYVKNDNISDRTAPVSSSPPITFTRANVSQKWLIFTGLSLISLVAAGYFTYRYTTSEKVRQINSIAVMPFTNESGNTDVEYLSDGITDSLISSLSDVPAVSVKARNSVFRYKGKDIVPKTVGIELSVQGLVLGRVLQRGGDIALHVELVDAGTETVLWSSDYNRPMANLASLQSEIARDVANRLRAKLTTAETQRVGRNYPTNSEAYELYLKGRYFANGKYTEESLRKSIEYYNEALAKDPDYALAYVGLAQSYLNLGDVWGFRPPKETFPLAKAAFTKALEIDDTLAEAHSAAADYQLGYEWNWTEAEHEIKKSLELNPDDYGARITYGSYFQARGQFDAAIKERKTARDIEPLLPHAVANVGYPMYYAGRYDEAIQQFQNALELDPNFAWSYLWIGQGQIEEGKTDDAINNIQKAINLSEGNIRMNATLGYAYARAGRRADAEHIIEQLRAKSKETYISPYFIAVIYAGLNDKDVAFEWLEKAYDERHPYLTLIAVEPVFRNLRSDPRFQDLKTRIGLPLTSSEANK